MGRKKLLIEEKTPRVLTMLENGVPVIRWPQTCTCLDKLFPAAARLPPGTTPPRKVTAKKNTTVRTDLYDMMMMYHSVTAAKKKCTNSPGSVC